MMSYKRRLQGIWLIARSERYIEIAPVPFGERDSVQFHQSMQWKSGIHFDYSNNRDPLF